MPGSRAAPRLWLPHIHVGLREPLGTFPCVPADGPGHRLNPGVTEHPELEGTREDHRAQLPPHTKPSRVSESTAPMLPALRLVLSVGSVSPACAGCCPGRWGAAPRTEGTGTPPPSRARAWHGGASLGPGCAVVSSPLTSLAGLVLCGEQPEPVSFSQGLLQEPVQPFHLLLPFREMSLTDT